MLRCNISTLVHLLIDKNDWPTLYFRSIFEAPEQPDLCCSVPTIAMDLTFLEASVPLTKTFKATPEGIEKSPYPNVSQFTSHHETASTVAGMYDALKDHAALNHCLLKGNTVRPLIKESRAASTVATTPTDWLCLDIDGLPAKTSIDSFLHALGIDDVTHIVQYSASAGIVSNVLRCHVFLCLTEPLSPPLIKQWLLHQNLTVPMLNTTLSLSSTNLSLKYGLDITTCQNDKLLYISAPILKGIKDPFLRKPRIKLVTRSYSTLQLDLSSVPSTDINQRASYDAVNNLRAAAGLPIRALKTSKANQYDVLSKPDDATISGIKHDRGFTYFNLNGGDSWGYYHPDNNPDYIHNFKGEPSYRTRDLLPAYWEDLKTKNAKEAVPLDPAPIHNGIQYLAFCDRRSSAYYRGTYDIVTNQLNLFQAKTETQVKHFLKQHGQPIGDFIPEWDRIYDPQSTTRIDVANRTVNTFEPSQYMASKPLRHEAPPATILRVIHHALGENELITRRFINWLAYIIQHRDRTLTAWVLHGTTKTGKGILIHRIIKPLLGGSNVAIRTQENLAEKFNDFLENALLVFVDEMEHSALENSRGVMAKLKNLITEEVIAIRPMNRNSYEVPNRTNWIFASNRPNPLAIDREDRRINVADYQATQTDITPTEIDSIKTELQHFYDFLVLLPVDLDAVRTPLTSESRDNLISVSESSIDSVIAEINNGNFEFLLEQLPTNDSYKLDMLQLTKVETYSATLKRLITRTHPITGVCNIDREELKDMLNYIVGGMPQSPHKFTSMLKHHKVIIQNVRLSDSQKIVKGIPAAWSEPDNFQRYLERFPSTVRQLKVVK